MVWKLVRLLYIYTFYISHFGCNYSLSSSAVELIHISWTQVFLTNFVLWREKHLNASFHSQTISVIVIIWRYIHTYICTYIHTYIHTHIHTYAHTYVHTYIHTYIQIQLHVPWLNHSALSSCFFNLSQFLCTSHQLISVVNFCWRANHLKHLISSYLQNLCLLNFGFGHLVRAAAVQLPLLGAPLLRQI